MNVGDFVRLRNPENGPFDKLVGRVVKVMGANRVRVAFPNGAGRTYHVDKLSAAVPERRTYPVATNPVENLAAGLPEDLPPPGTPFVDPQDVDEIDTVIDEVEDEAPPSPPAE